MGGREVDVLQLVEQLPYSLMLPFFAAWLLIAVRQAFGFSWPRAAALVAVGGFINFIFLGALWDFFAGVVGWVVASPFLLILLFFLMRGYLADVMRGQRARASFRQNLEVATLNPADASAHYNLGLLHLQRRELAQARARFERAVEIDPEETDAHYQLGRIARAEGRWADAIRHYGETLSRDQSHAQYEVWREAAATYVSAGQHQDALDALERFLEHRQADPEGLYLMGRAHAGLGRRREAVEWLQRCIEAVRTSPAYKYRSEKRWASEAQQFLRSLA
jgi:tetratricopeptide (TPR) repeat protein